jgi:hypothetical protein
MFLTAYNLPHYLLWKGLISPGAIVDGDLVLAEAGRRNRNFKVLLRKQPGLFVKQIKSTEPQAIATVQREATFYKNVHSDPRLAALAGMIPKFIDYESRRHALTLGLTDRAESMAERHLREAVFPEDSARLLGTALATVHSQGVVILRDPVFRAQFPFQLPWPLLLDQTGYSFLDGFGPIGLQLSAALRQFPSLQFHLSALRPLWQYDSLIHGDMKWDNCLIRNSEPARPELTIVDWELADIGDGAWDVATIFKEYVVTAILSAQTPQATAQPGAGHIAPPKQNTIETLQPSVRSFWNAYSEARGFPGPTSQAFLDRAVRFTAARMVIAVLEYLAGSQQLGALGNAMLQASVNILEAPQVAAIQLIGVPVT